MPLFRPLPSVFPFWTEFSAFRVHIEHCADTSNELSEENINKNPIRIILRVLILQRYGKSNSKHISERESSFL